MSKMPTNSGVIIALLPDDEYVRVRPEAFDHHLTVLFLGRTDDPEITEKSLNQYWKGLEELWQFKINAEITANAMFDTPDGWANVDLIDGPMLPEFRSISQELLQVYGLPLDNSHGFLPHITRRYIKQTHSNQIELVQRKGKMKFTLNRVALWAGDFRLERELT